MRYIRIVNTCIPAGQLINLNEIEAWVATPSGPVNVALGKYAWSSSAFGPTYLPATLTDGVRTNTVGTGGFFNAGSTDTSSAAFVAVDLGSSYNVTNITVWNRNECAVCIPRDIGDTVLALDAANVTLASFALSGVLMSENFTLDGNCTTCQPASGIRMVNLPGTNYLEIVQMQAFNMTGGNVALGSAATTSSVVNPGCIGGPCLAAYAVNGWVTQQADLAPAYQLYNSASPSAAEWWMTKWLQPAYLSYVRFTNRYSDTTCTSCANRAVGQVLYILGVAGSPLAAFPLTAAITQDFYCTGRTWTIGSPSPSPSTTPSRSISSSVSASRSVSPSATAVRPCDASGACYAQAPGGAIFSWSSGEAACRTLGAGWHLATIIDNTTAYSVMSGCAGLIPQSAGAAWWTGLYDVAPLGTRPAGVVDKTYTGWRWASNVSACWFQQRQAAYWWNGSVAQPYPQPDDNSGLESCGNALANFNGFLNDAQCGLASYACCSVLPASAAALSCTPSATLSPSPSSSLSASPSPSTTFTGTGTATLTATRTASLSAGVSSSGTPAGTTSSSATATGSRTAASSATPSATVTASMTASTSGSAPQSASSSGSATLSLGASASVTPTSSPTSSLPPGASASTTASTSPSGTSAPSDTPFPTSTPMPPSATPSPASASPSAAAGSPAVSSSPGAAPATASSLATPSSSATATASLSFGASPSTTATATGSTPAAAGAAAAAVADSGSLPAIAGGAAAAVILIAVAGIVLVRRRQRQRPVTAAVASSDAASAKGAVPSSSSATAAELFNPLHASSGRRLGHSDSLAASSRAAYASQTPRSFRAPEQPAIAPAAATAAPSAEYDRIWSSEHSAYYWQHRVSGESTWDDPSGRSQAAAAAAAAPSSGEEAQRAEALSGLLPGWTPVWSRSHNTYYWRSAAGESVWEKPALRG